MMLVQALLTAKGSKKSLLELYEIAIKANFRFYSFGDAMMII
jgi:S-adenosylmethionine:tRNA ribosyltransferase-isomerase